MPPARVTRRAAQLVPSEVPTDYVLLGQIGSSGKDKSVFEAEAADGARVAVACYHAGKGKRLQVEAEFQSRAAAHGLAPPVIEADVRRRRLISELMPGGTLIDVAKRQGGRLTASQQQRLLHILLRLGQPEAAGGAGLRHGDSANPCNWIAGGADGRTLFLIDFAPPHCRAMKPSETPDANLGSLGLLLWHPESGLLRREWLIEPPALLLRTYRLYCRKKGFDDPMDPNPEELPAAPEADDAAAETAAKLVRGLEASHPSNLLQAVARRSRNPTIKAPRPAPPVIDLSEATVETEDTGLAVGGEAAGEGPGDEVGGATTRATDQNPCDDVSATHAGHDERGGRRALMLSLAVAAVTAVAAAGAAAVFASSPPAEDVGGAVVAVAVLMEPPPADSV